MKLQQFFVVICLLIAVISAENTEKSDGEDKKLSKRGLVNFGGFPNPYQSPYGYQIPAGIPPFHPRHNLGFRAPPLFGLNTPYALRHGGATVTSYNANFPRYPYYLNNLYNSLPYPGVINPFVPAAEQAPPLAFGSSPVPFHRPVLQPIPIGVSTAPIPSSYPQTLFPIGIPAPPKQGPPFLATPTPSLNVVPDEWRPIFVNQPTPIPTPTIPRPAITLLPPYDHQRSSFSDELTQQDLLRLQGHQFVDSSNQFDQEKHHNLFHQHQQQEQEILETQLNADGNSSQNGYFGASSYDVPLQGNKGFHY